jgi:hypothetical protein
MNNRASMLAGLGAGASLAYFFDSARGARRRARLRDSVVHAASVSERAIRTVGRDGMHRTAGTAAWLRSGLRRARVGDAVLRERVRARLGRATSHAHAIAVNVSNGVVALSGPILSTEASPLLRAIRHVRGVQDVIDDLDRHDERGNLPALQGGRPRTGRRLDILRRRWSPVTRCVAGTAGVALTAIGLGRRDVGGALMAIVGSGLMTRSAANRPLSEMVGVGDDPGVQLPTHDKAVG